MSLITQCPIWQWHNTVQTSYNWLLASYHTIWQQYSRRTVIEININYVRSPFHTHTHTHTHTPETVPPFKTPTILERAQLYPSQSQVTYSSIILYHWNNIVAETNRYARQMMTPLQHDKGFCIFMGIVKLPSIENYWRRYVQFHYSPIASKISRDRIALGHFTDNTTPDSRHPR